MLLWKEPVQPCGRRLAVTDQVEVGAVFPPIGEARIWRWRMWLNGKSWPTEGKAASELDAKKMLEWAWEQFLYSAGLRSAA
jgi:hypothetical protein